MDENRTQEAGSLPSPAHFQRLAERQAAMSAIPWHPEMRDVAEELATQAENLGMLARKLQPACEQIRKAAAEGRPGQVLALHGALFNQAAGLDLAGLLAMVLRVQNTIGQLNSLAREKCVADAMAAAVTP